MKILSHIFFTMALISALPACGQNSTSNSPGIGAIPADKIAEARATDFYRWYVALLANDKIAIDDPQHYADYVSSALRRTVKRLMASPDGLDADYFIKAQDFEDDWASRIAARVTARSAKRVKVIVTLGDGTTSPWPLDVSMVLEDGRWKVAEVSHLRS